MRRWTKYHIKNGMMCVCVCVDWKDLVFVAQQTAIRSQQAFVKHFQPWLPIFPSAAQLHPLKSIKISGIENSEIRSLRLKRSQRVCPWKWMVGRWSGFFLGWPIFRGFCCWFQGVYQSWLLDKFLKFIPPTARDSAVPFDFARLWWPLLFYRCSDPVRSGAWTVTGHLVEMKWFQLQRGEFGLHQKSRLGVDI